MPDYKELYLTMVRASEDAINMLIAAQQKCERLYLDAPEPALTCLESGRQDTPGTDPET